MASGKISGIIKSVDINCAGLEIKNGAGPYYAQVLPNPMPSDFHDAIGYCYPNSWSEAVRTIVLKNGIAFSADSKITLGNNVTVRLYYI